MHHKCTCCELPVQLAPAAQWLWTNDIVFVRGLTRQLPAALQPTWAFVMALPSVHASF